MGGVTGGVRWGLNNHNTLTIRRLSEFTGGLGEKIENWRLKIENSANLLTKH